EGGFKVCGQCWREGFEAPLGLPAKASLQKRLTGPSDGVVNCQSLSVVDLGRGQVGGTDGLTKPCTENVFEESRTDEKTKLFHSVHLAHHVDTTVFIAVSISVKKK